MKTQPKEGFIITTINIIPESVTRELKMRPNEMEVNGYTEYLNGTKSETITLSLDIELQSSGNTSKITTNEVIQSLINKLTEEREKYP